MLLLFLKPIVGCLG